jgi:hypothetical protein
MSILSFISVLVLSIYFFVFYIEKNEVNVLFVTEEKQFTSFMDLNCKPFFFKLMSGDGKETDPTIADVSIRSFCTRMEATQERW